MRLESEKGAREKGEREGRLYNNNKKKRFERWLPCSPLTPGTSPGLSRRRSRRTSTASARDGCAAEEEARSEEAGAREGQREHSARLRRCRRSPSCRRRRRRRCSRPTRSPLERRTTTTRGPAPPPPTPTPTPTRAPPRPPPSSPSATPRSGPACSRCRSPSGGRGSAAGSRSARPSAPSRRSPCAFRGFFLTFAGPLFSLLAPPARTRSSLLFFNPPFKRSKIGLNSPRYVISKFAERYEARSYGQLVRRALGRKLALSLRLVLSTYLCGSCVAYMVIVGDCFTPLLSSLVEKLGGGGGGGGSPPPPPLSTSLFLPFPPSLSSPPSLASLPPPQPHPAAPPLVNRAHVIWAAAALVAYPLCLPRTLGALARVSAAAVAGFAVTAAAVVARGLEAVSARGRHHRWDGMTRGVRTDYGALFAVPIVVFGFNCHANVVSVFTELERHPEVFGLPSSPAAFASWARTLPSLAPVPPAPRTRKLIGMLGVIATAVRERRRFALVFFVPAVEEVSRGRREKQKLSRKKNSNLTLPSTQQKISKITERSPSSPSGTSPWASRATRRSPRPSAGTF